MIQTVTNNRNVFTGKISNGNVTQNRRKLQNHNNGLNNNSLNFVDNFNNSNNNYNYYMLNNNQNILNKSQTKEIASERTPFNKDYNYKKINYTNSNNNNNNYTNNSVSINNLIINNQKNIKNMNNKSLDWQDFNFMKKNEEKDSDNKNRSHYRNNSKMSINKSMDSKRLFNKGKENHIIGDGNSKIINLSNLNNFSYATKKYNCYYENKRAKPELFQPKKNSDTKVNINYPYQKENPKNIILYLKYRKYE